MSEGELWGNKAPNRDLRLTTARPDRPYTGGRKDGYRRTGAVDTFTMLGRRCVCELKGGGSRPNTTKKTVKQSSDDDDDDVSLFSLFDEYMNKNDTIHA